MIIKLIKGFLAFLNDGRRLLVWFVKSPLAVAVALSLFFGAFYMAGIAPHEIGGWFKNTAAPAVGRRIDYLKADAEGMSDLAKKKLAEKGVVLQNAQPVKKQIRPIEKETVPESRAEQPTLADIEAFENEMLGRRPRRAAPLASEEEPSAVYEAQQQQAAENVAWAQVMQETPADPLAEYDASEIVQGVARVVGADKIKVDGRLLKLDIVIRPGKAGAAYQALKQEVDSVTVRCLLPEDAAVCFYNNKDITDVLFDRMLAD
ncbi:MAG TPA: hypothetical protein DD624_03510 [Alphaproteobacteria bacterium]|nr:hypothetical protein [Alphaproteobacteria bacterium]